MTYTEKFLQEHPDCSADIANRSCPWRYGYEDTDKCPRYESGHVMSCVECWNREIPVDDTTVKHWILVDGTTGVCPNCHKQDHIDPLAKYCRYCGTRLEVEE